VFNLIKVISVFYLTCNRGLNVRNNCWNTIRYTICYSGSRDKYDFEPSKLSKRRGFAIAPSANTFHFRFR